MKIVRLFNIKFKNIIISIFLIKKQAIVQDNKIYFDEMIVYIIMNFLILHESLQRLLHTKNNIML